jgi:hypothetical protein
MNPPPACPFHTRCWKAQDVCRTVEPPLTELAPGHRAACHFPENYPPNPDGSSVLLNRPNGHRTEPSEPTERTEAGENREPGEPGEPGAS